MTQAIGYIGRFAPSPSGPLHLGSLTTAVASYLDAQQHQGQWRLRMDDLDTPRNQPGASDAILRCLEQHQLLWHGEVIYQSERLERYREAADLLIAQQQIFYCQCSRRMLKPMEPYPGTCHHRLAAPAPASSTDLGYALRIHTRSAEVSFQDQIAGPQQHSMASLGGDFVVWRRDNQPSYQLATALDDGSTGITHIVRGNDLLADTARQLFLVEHLGGVRASYAHLPVVVDNAQVKLSKRTGAKPIDDLQPSKNLLQVLGLLGIPAPLEMVGASPQELLSWATQRWQLPGAETQTWQAGEN